MSTNNNYIAIDEEIIKKIINAFEGLRFGSVLITVHNSKVVQIDRKEKTRLEQGYEVDIGGGI
ncbi:MAG: DUF2292 domain-containing protein [Endomicrobiales bacterium]|jgi:hypothetical protein